LVAGKLLQLPQRLDQGWLSVTVGKPVEAHAAGRPPLD
jgi:hypothetical protein